MPRSHKGSDRQTRARSLFHAIGELSTMLPTVEQRTHALNAVSELEAFLRDVRTWLETVPVQTENGQLRSALATLDDLAAKVEQAPLLSGVFGTSAKAKPRKNAPPPVGSGEQAERLLASFRDQSLDQIRQQLLEDESIPVRDLRAMAASLSLRVSSKVSRQHLAHQLTVRIANARGYRHLSGGDNTEEVEAEVRPATDEGSIEQA